jgi:acetyl-CoA carboxylase carboxyltransferase component
MVKNTSHMFITGPDVVKAVTGEDVTFEELGGAMTHNQISGVAHMAANSEADCLYLIREMFSYLPSNNMEDPPFVPGSDDALRTEAGLDTLVPENPKEAYDIKDAIHMIVDNSEFYEIQEHYAQNIVVGFASTGDVKASVKGFHFPLSMKCVIRF